jgi:hypothetical protein
LASFISHKYRLIFCHVPRTGGTSFTEAITPFLGERDDISLYEKHTPLRIFKVGETEKVFEEYLKVAFVRDEGERLRSLQKDPPINVSPYDDYWGNIRAWVADGAGELLADVLINFHNLPGSAMKFLGRLGINIFEYPHLNNRE